MDDTTVVLLLILLMVVIGAFNLAENESYRRDERQTFDIMFELLYGPQRPQHTYVNVNMVSQLSPHTSVPY